MKKINTFIYVLKSSLTAVPSYYRELLNPKTSVWFSIKYHLMLALIITLVSAARFTYGNAPKVRQTIKDYGMEVINSYPAELEITFGNKTYEINQEEPFSIPLSASGKITEQQLKDLGFRNLVTFYREGTIEDLERFETLMLVNDANVIVRDAQEGSYGVQPLPWPVAGQEESLTITKELVDQLIPFVDTVAGAYTTVAIATFSFIWFALFFMFGRFFYFLVVALAILGAAAIARLGTNYAGALKITIHAVTLSAVIEFFVRATGIEIPLNYGFSLLHVIFAFAVVIVLSNTREQQVEEQEFPQISKMGDDDNVSSGDNVNGADKSGDDNKTEQN